MVMHQSHKLSEVGSIPVVTTKYVPCPECRGEGKQMIARMYPTGHTECWEDCDFCDGEGDFEEADYIIMKLEGKV